MRGNVREPKREDCGGGFKNKGDIEAVVGCIQLKIRETLVVIYTDFAIARNRVRRIPHHHHNCWNQSGLPI